MNESPIMTREYQVNILKKAMQTLQQLQSFAKHNPGVNLPVTEAYCDNLAGDLMDVIRSQYHD